MLPAELRYHVQIRNPKIARILYYSKDIESFGTGLKRIADACETAGIRYGFQKRNQGL